jgi:hypothetical protein
MVLSVAIPIGPGSATQEIAIKTLLIRTAKWSCVSFFLVLVFSERLGLLAA